MRNGRYETLTEIAARMPRVDANDTRPFHVRLGEAYGIDIEDDHAAQMMIENKNYDGTPFDGVAAFEKMKRENPDMFKPHRNAPRLTHEGQCQVYAALYVGDIQSVVAKAFDVSRATVSLIAGCRNDRRKPVTFEIGEHSETLQTKNLTRRHSDGRKVRYSHIEDEFDSLGEAEFIRRYYTSYVQSRIKNAKSQIKTRVWLD